MMKRRTGELRRPTISEPTGFRKIDGHEPNQRHDGFTPLELSIYLPQNRLSPLPDFSAPDDQALVLAPGTFSVLSRSSSQFRIARKPLKPSVDLSSNNMDEFRSVDTRSVPSIFSLEGLVQPLRPRPSLPISLNASHEATYLKSKQLPKPPPTLRACSYTGPMYPTIRRDSDPFVSGHDQLRKDRAVSGQTVLGRPGADVFGTGTNMAVHPDNGM